ncbi:MAG: hypothetical protein U5K79_11945 [Cyclobacteriaceae bacterium]|nr:hypothetical protein [Cyclobacteriaceae bacterium]
MGWQNDGQGAMDITIGQHIRRHRRMDWEIDGSKWRAYVGPKGKPAWYLKQ